MAKSWQYSRLRRTTMQAVLWLILGATVAAAHFVSRYKQQSLRVDLGPPVKLGDVLIRLPAGWTATRTTARGVAETLNAIEKPNDDSSRQLLVVSEQLSVPMSIIEYLQRKGVLPGDNSPPVRGAPRILGQIDFGPGGGLLVDASMRVLINNTVEKNIVACTILPGRQAIIVRLAGSAPFDPVDEQIVRQVAASLTSNIVQSSAGQLTLPGGIRIGLPDGYKLLNETDPLITERQALLETPDGHWASLTLIPCILFPGEREDAIKTLLSTRGLQWWNVISTVHPRNSNQEYAFGPLGESSNSYVTQGYLKVSPTGQALMAFFHGATTELPLFEHAWEQLTLRTQFNPDFKANDLLAAGVAVQRGATTTESGSPSTPGSAEWWLWRHVASDWNYGWTRTTYTDPSARSGVYEARWRNKDDPQHVSQVTVGWSTDFAAHAFQRNQNRRELQPGSPPSDAFTQNLRIDAGKFTSTASFPFLNKPLIWTQSLPSQFVPGTLLPLLLPRLAGQPLILRTDLFADCEGLPMLEPFTLIIHPTPPATSQPTTNSLHNITIEVNGSGRISRWYFNPDGSIAYIDFAGGLRRQRTDVSRIHELFDHDPQLQPQGY